MRTIIKIRKSPLMTRCLSDCFNERTGGRDAWGVYVDAFASRGMTLRFAKHALEHFYCNEEEYLDLRSLET